MRDYTFRGRLRYIFNVTLTGLSDAFESVLEKLIVHVNKVVLLALFLVAVWRPTIVNFLLFIMFLVMLLISRQHERLYLRLTIALNSVIIVLIYVIDVINERDYASYAVWTLYTIGV